jgi:hypothetical protein
MDDHKRCAASMGSEGCALERFSVDGRRLFVHASNLCLANDQTASVLDPTVAQ